MKNKKVIDYVLDDLIIPFVVGVGLTCLVIVILSGTIVAADYAYHIMLSHS